MEACWIYEVPNAQAAFDAVLAVEGRYTPDEITGLAVISREGSDDRETGSKCCLRWAIWHHKGTSRRRGVVR